MRLLKDNTIVLAQTERGEFFAVYDPTEKDPESRDRVTLGDVEIADWLKFAFVSKAEDEGNARQKRVWLRAASLIGEVCKRLGGGEGAAPFWTGPGYRGEYQCPHGVGHGNHIHGCDGCCQRDDFPISRSRGENPDKGECLEQEERKEPLSG